MTKLLEQEEAMLLNRLQQTYQTEQQMNELLSKTNDKSPVKQMQSQKMGGSQKFGLQSTPVKKWSWEKNETDTYRDVKGTYSLLPQSIDFWIRTVKRNYNKS